MKKINNQKNITGAVTLIIVVILMAATFAIYAAMTVGAAWIVVGTETWTEQVGTETYTWYEYEDYVDYVQEPYIYTITVVTPVIETEIIEITDYSLQVNMEEYETWEDGGWDTTTCFATQYEVDIFNSKPQSATLSAPEPTGTSTIIETLIEPKTITAPVKVGDEWYKVVTTTTLKKATTTTVTVTTVPLILPAEVTDVSADYALIDDAAYDNRKLGSISTIIFEDMYGNKVTAIEGTGSDKNYYLYNSDNKLIGTIIIEKIKGDDYLRVLLDDDVAIVLRQQVEKHKAIYHKVIGNDNGKAWVIVEKGKINDIWLVDAFQTVDATYTKTTSYRLYNVTKIEKYKRLYGQEVVGTDYTDVQVGTTYEIEMYSTEHITQIGTSSSSEPRTGYNNVARPGTRSIWREGSRPIYAEFSREITEWVDDEEEETTVPSSETEEETTTEEPTTTEAPTETVPPQVEEEITEAPPPQTDFPTEPEEEPEEEITDETEVPLISIKPEEPEKVNPQTGVNMFAWIIALSVMGASAATFGYYSKNKKNHLK